MSSADTATEDTSAEDAPAEESGPSDEMREALLAEIAGLLGDSLVESHIVPGKQLYLRVTPESWKETHRVLRDEMGFKFFEFLSAIDWMPSPFGKSEDASADAGIPVTKVEDPGEIEQGFAGGETRFQVFTRVVDISHDTPGKSVGVIVKVDVPDPHEDPEPVLETLLSIYPGTNWHEREIHEMFGIGFTGHPYLEKLYLPTDFEGNPLRKDFPLLARHVKPWPGIVDVEPMPDDADESDDDSGAAAEGGDDA
ncbi:MAG: NADH-quinone oxidoreductase subunit C [Acidimicrobiales bacterium]|nr:NADH-quinone oxidoreductase subunit C [Acidimicrobiales bacterium]